MDSAMIQHVIAFVIYLGLMIYVGIRWMNTNNNSEDFFLGGRNLGPWTTALSAEASDMSGWLLMGLPGLAYLGGIKEAFWTALGLEIGTYLNWLIVAKPLRKYSIACGNSITIPQFLTNRFKDKKRLISLVSSIFIMFFFAIYTASGFVACAKLLNTVFELPYICGLVIGTVVILLYTLLGGFGAVCTTDFIQGTLMFISLIITLAIVTVTLGGPAESFAKVSEFSNKAINGELGNELREKFLGNKNFSVISIISALAWGLGYFGMPHILVRFMGIRSNAEIKISRRIAMIWVTIAFIGAVAIGAFATVFLPEQLSAGASESVIIKCITKIYQPFIGGIFLCAILAAAMSTADSQLLVAASAFTEDCCQTLLNKKFDANTTVRISRITVLAIAAVAFVLSLDESSSIFKLVSYAWAGFGSTFGPLVLLALFWRNATAKGAVAGIICGAVTVIVWHNLHGGIFDVYEILPGFLVCLVLAVVISCLDKNKDPEMLAEFDKYKKLAD
ncbi:MAG: sodium/proline symporter PutP [Treponema sp.]|nr:sodium/proline symporter PutP [Treponema sp.]MBQ5569417.1 sodium/proline symporter PutP [Treponema sp.]